MRLLILFVLMILFGFPPSQADARCRHGRTPVRTALFGKQDGRRTPVRTILKHLRPRHRRCR